MYDKLGIINTCLGLTGNNLVNTEEDGSDEWTIGSIAYEAAVAYLIASHDWKFETAIVTVQRKGDSDEDSFEDVYRKPQNSLGLVWVKQGECPLDWKIIGNDIYTTAVAGDQVKVKVVLRGDPSAWNPLFVQSLYSMTKSGIYAGLNEDKSAADSEESKALEYLAQARSRTDREDKPRPVFRSRMLARRRGRA